MSTAVSSGNEGQAKGTGLSFPAPMPALWKRRPRTQGTLQSCRPSGGSSANFFKLPLQQ